MWKWILGRGWPESQEKRKQIELLNVKQVQEIDPESQISCHYCTGRINFNKFIYSCCTLGNVRAPWMEALWQKGGWSWGCAPLSLPVCERDWHDTSSHVGMCGASNFVLMFHKDLECFKLPHSKRSLKYIFSILAFLECFPCIGQQFSLASQEFFPVSHMCLRRCQFSICGLKTTSIFSFSCASVIYVSKLKDKGYPPPVAFTGWATGGPEWCGLLFLDVRKSVTAESREKRDFYTTDGTLK